MPLMPVALQLKDYTFSRIELKPNEAFINSELDLNEGNPIDIESLDCKIQALNIPSPDEDLVLALDVWVTDEALENNARCYISLGMMGRFSLPNTIIAKYSESMDVKSKIIGNCATILYGAMRDQVHSLSLKMPFGAIVLPTCSFQHLIPLEENTTANKEPVKAAKKKRARKPKDSSPAR